MHSAELLLRSAQKWYGGGGGGGGLSDLHLFVFLAGALLCHQSFFFFLENEVEQFESRDVEFLIFDFKLSTGG